MGQLCLVLYVSTTKTTAHKVEQRLGLLWMCYDCVLVFFDVKIMFRLSTLLVPSLGLSPFSIELTFLRGRNFLTVAHAHWTFLMHPGWKRSDERVEKKLNIILLFHPTLGWKCETTNRIWVTSELNCFFTKSFHCTFEKVSQPFDGNATGEKDSALKIHPALKSQLYGKRALSLIV